MNIVLMMGGTFAVLTALAYGFPTLQGPSVSELLQRYARGESIGDSVSPYLRTSTAFSAFLRDLEREAPRASAPILATFALHAASLAFRQAPMADGPSGRQNALAILELGCSKLRGVSRSPSPFEDRWQVLAADLITSSTGRKSGSAETLYMNAHLPYDGHFKHVYERGRSDPDLALRSARYEQAQFYVWRLTHGVAVFRSEGGLSNRHAKRYEAVRRLEIVLSRLAPLILQPKFEEEARARSGDALLHLDREEEAFQVLGDRPFEGRQWEYIRRLLRARSFIRRSLAADARREYEAAIAIAPQGRPAKLALGGLAYLAGQRDVAERLFEAESKGNEPDQWVTYMYPGAAGWNERLEALRKEALGVQ